jgi:ceramide glucosyltransferase
MTAVWMIVILGVIVGTGYYAFGLYSTWAFFRACRPNPRTGTTPPVTLLKPLKGLGTGIEANLESFCTLDYPEYQILFAVADPKDPAIEVVQQLRQRYPHLDMDLVIDPRKLGANRKVSSLIHMVPFAKHDVLVLSDEDIRVPRDYLAHIVRPFAAPDVGLVTCLYRAMPSRGAPSRMEALYINTDFMPMVLVARLVERFRYAFGATIAIRRAALDAIGGFGAIKDYLADDYQIGYQITEKNYRIVLSPLVVETHLDNETWGSLGRHQLRWARTNRVCRPGGYFFSVLTHGTSWATAFLLLSGFSATGWQVFLTTTVVRLIQAATIGGSYISSRQTLRDLWLVPIKDWLATALWVTSFLGNQVEWSGERMDVRPDGKMTPIAQRNVEAPAVAALDGRALALGPARGASARSPESEANGTMRRQARREGRTI